MMPRPGPRAPLALPTLLCRACGHVLHTKPPDLKRATVEAWCDADGCENYTVVFVIAIDMVLTRSIIEPETYA